MDSKELPGMLHEAGIATEEQAAILLRFIQEQEAIELDSHAGIPAPPRGLWRSVSGASGASEADR